MSFSGKNAQSSDKALDNVPGNSDIKTNQKKPWEWLKLFNIRYCTVR